MLVTRDPKHSKMIDDLVFIAGGDLDLVMDAVRYAARETGSADLKDVVSYIKCQTSHQNSA